MSESYNPSSYELLRADVKSYAGVTDTFRDIITGMEIAQNLNGAYHGSLIVLDNLNKLEGLPLRGEEELDLEFRMSDTGEVFELKCQIYNIDNIQTNRIANGVSYVMHFMSRTSYRGGLRRVRSSHKNKAINQIVREVFTDYVSDLGNADYQDEKVRSRVLSFGTARYSLLEDNTRNLYIQPTEGLVDIIVPNMMPEDTFHFLSKRAMNTDAPSHTFRFFETIYNYYFVTDEFFIKEAIAKENNSDSSIPTLTYAPNMSNLASEPQMQINRIDTLSIASRGTNAAQSLLSGAYSVKTVEIDLVQGKVERKWWNYAKDAKFIDMSGEVASVSRLPHSDGFINETFTEENARTFVVLKDTQGPLDRSTSLRSDANNGEVTAMKNFYRKHLDETSIGVTLKGRMDLVPGMIINLNIPNFSSANNTEDNNLSGKYLIKSTNHTFQGDRVGTTMNLVKFGWS